MNKRYLWFNANRKFNFMIRLFLQFPQVLLSKLYDVPVVAKFRAVAFVDTNCVESFYRRITHQNKIEPAKSSEYVSPVTHEIFRPAQKNHASWPRRFKIVVHFLFRTMRIDQFSHLKYSKKLRRRMTNFLKLRGADLYMGEKLWNRGSFLALIWYFRYSREWSLYILHSTGGLKQSVAFD